MCNFISDRHALCHWKCVLKYCVNCPSLIIPVGKSDSSDTYTCQTNNFHFYQQVSLCTVHAKRQFEEKPTCSLCPIFPTLKRLFLMDTPFAHFHEKFYIPDIQNMEFNLQNI